MTLLRLKFPVAVLPFFCTLLFSVTGCETSAAQSNSFLPQQAKAPQLRRSQSDNPTQQEPELIAQKSKPQALPVAAAPDATKPKPDPADGVIAQAEKEYAAGQANYQAGHLEAARANFDQAFNTLLSSNLDVRNNDRLEREFEKIVEAVHELEMSALQQGDGFNEPRSEPAPIDEANDINTFPVDPNIKAKAEVEVKNTKSDLPLVMNDQVAMFINYYSSPRGKATLEHAWARAGRYHEMVSRVLKEEGVPQDLIYLAQAESGFQPLALSRAGARGMWQFMAQTGELYGLSRTWWVDDRQDPEKATRAAARHLHDLYNQFGDWYLAMAAYNSGASTVQHAVERTGYADFWELYRRGVLPQETRNYVPIIVAETIMAKNPEQYGLQAVAPEPAVQLDHIIITYPVDLRLVAECVDSSVDYLQEINPSLLRMTTPKDQPFTLNLPAGSQEKYETAIAAIPLDMRTYWRYHRVEYGDSLGSLARKYHVSSSAIADANSLSGSAGDSLQPGAKLIIPIAPGRHEGQAEGYSRKATHYKVRKGDTVTSVADDFEVSVDKLRKWNHLRATSALTPGRMLVIYKPTSSDSSASTAGSEPSETKSSSAAKPSKSAHTTAGTDSKYHKVKKGETLSSIAETNHTSIEALKRDNPKLAANLRAGDVLVIKKQ
jgi:membrane-bound lytic murein transglycosylase D